MTFNEHSKHLFKNLFGLCFNMMCLFPLLFLVSISFHPCRGELVDLTHSFDGSTINWNTQKPLTIDTTFTGTIPGKDIWSRKESMSAGTTHSGTHMDAPCHVTKNGWCITDIPLDHLVALEAVVVDIREDVGEDREVHLSLEHLISWEEEHGRIPDGSLLLVCTGWSRYWPDRLSYLGTEGFNARLMRFPSISGRAAKWLRSHRKIVGIGIDSITIDVNNQKEESHLALLSINVYALENLKNLEQLPATGSTVHVMPTKLKGASGAPCRVVAEIP